MPGPGWKLCPVSFSESLAKWYSMGMFSGLKKHIFHSWRRQSRRTSSSMNSDFPSPGRPVTTRRRRVSKVQFSSRLLQPVSAPRCRPFSKRERRLSRQSAAVKTPSSGTSSACAKVMRRLSAPYRIRCSFASLHSGPKCTRRQRSAPSRHISSCCNNCPALSPSTAM